MIATGFVSFTKNKTAERDNPPECGRVNISDMVPCAHLIQSIVKILSDNRSDSICRNSANVLYTAQRAQCTYLTSDK
jgi:hypothetical protein